MLIDMHAHTSGISWCCRADAQTVLNTARENGIDGLVLCNHYQELYVQNGDPTALAQSYVQEYVQTKELADAMGMPLFFGVEVTASQHDNAHILLYGLQPDFVLRHPAVYEYPLEKITALVHAEGGLAVQAHPFRNGGYLLDLSLLDGVEVNCHPLYDATHCDELLGIAGEAGLLVTCGGDYHADTYRAVCGTHFPDNARDNAALVAYLKQTEQITLHVHEVRTEDHRDVVFHKTL